jgi:hypothetical protein
MLYPPPAACRGGARACLLDGFLFIPCEEHLVNEFCVILSRICSGMGQFLSCVPRICSDSRKWFLAWRRSQSTQYSAGLSLLVNWKGRIFNVQFSMLNVQVPELEALPSRKLDESAQRVCPSSLTEREECSMFNSQCSMFKSGGTSFCSWRSLRSWCSIIFEQKNAKEAKKRSVCRNWKLRPHCERMTGSD